MLDPRREKFAQGVASGLSLSDAYRQANPNAARWKPETVWQYGSRWMADGKVSARVDALKAIAAKNAILTRQEWLQRMIDVADGGEDQPSRLKALIEFGKAEGFFAPEKKQISGADGGPIVIRIGGKDMTPDELGW